MLMDDVMAVMAVVLMVASISGYCRVNDAHAYSRQRLPNVQLLLSPVVKPQSTNSMIEPQYLFRIKL